MQYFRLDKLVQNPVGFFFLNILRPGGTEPGGALVPNADTYQIYEIDYALCLRSSNVQRQEGGEGVF